jgi:hypothetical protein
MDDLKLNYMKLILSADMNVSVSIETYITYGKPFICDRETYLKFGQKLMTILLKLEIQ